MTTQIAPAGSSSSAQRRWLGILLGLLLLLPASLCCGTSLAGPTVQTFLLSLRSGGALSPGDWVGTDNYARLAGLSGLGAVLGFTLAIVFVRLVAVAIVPPVLGLAAARLSGWMRSGLRIVFMLPVTLFAPTALAASWALASRGGGSSLLSSPGGARTLVLFIDGATVLGVGCGLGLIAYLATRRTGEDDASGRTRLTTVLVWVVMAAAAVASGLQTFGLPFVLTGGGPAQATTTLAIEQYRIGFAQLRFGPAAALATVTIGLVAILGLIVGVLVALTGVSLRISGGSASSAQGSGLAIIIALLAAVLALVVWGISQGPLAQALLASGAGAGERAAGAFAQPGILTDSFLPPLAVLLIQLPVTYLAALGIGALRPLGRASEWLLLPFSPWLFVTIGPLSLAAFNNLRQAGQLNTAAALLPSFWVSVPMLFVLTLFFKGCAGRWAAARAGGRSATGAFLGEVIGPSIPLALLVGVIGMLTSSQELLWSAIATTQRATINVALARAIGQLAAPPAALASGIRLVVLPAFGLAFIALAILHVLYVDRLVLRREPDASGPASKN